MVIKESAERKVSQQLSQMIQGSLYSEVSSPCCKAQDALVSDSW